MGVVAVGEPGRLRFAVAGHGDSLRGFFLRRSVVIAVPAAVSALMVVIAVADGGDAMTLVAASARITCAPLVAHGAAGHWWTAFEKEQGDDPCAEQDPKPVL